MPVDMIILCHIDLGGVGSCLRRVGVDLYGDLMTMSAIV